MILFKKRYCRRHGHQLNLDPGDIVLHCLRCGALLDVYAALEGIERRINDRGGAA